MSIPVIIIKRIIAVLSLSRRVTQFISQSQAIVEAIGNEATTFPTPSPALATVTTHITDLQAKENAAKMRTSGAVQARNASLNVVAGDLRGLTAYVQRIADGDPVNAEAIVLSAGLKVKKVTARVKPDFAVKNDKVSGSVLLIAKAQVRVSHDWQSSLNGTNWTALPSTIQAKTIVSGLNPGAKMYFRHRTVTKDGPGSWSQVVNVIVL